MYFTFTYVGVKRRRSRGRAGSCRIFFATDIGSRAPEPDWPAEAEFRAARRAHFVARRATGFAAFALGLGEGVITDRGRKISKPIAELRGGRSVDWSAVCARVHRSKCSARVPFWLNDKRRAQYERIVDA